MHTIQERGEALRRYIKSRGMTQKEAAEKIGISAPHMANLLNGRDGMGQKKVGKIVSAFPELSEAYLLTGEGSLIDRGPVQHLDHVRNSGNIVNGGSVIQGDAALAAENAQLREQLAKANEEKDRLLGIIETLTNKP